MFKGLFCGCLSATPIQNDEEAFEMAQAALQNKWHVDYSSYTIDFGYIPERGVYHFRYLDPDMFDEFGRPVLLGGIGPGVEIRKSDGKIKYLKGQK